MATAEVEVGRYSKLGRQAAALTTKLPAPTLDHSCQPPGVRSAPIGCAWAEQYSTYC